MFFGVVSANLTQLGGLGGQLWRNCLHSSRFSVRRLPDLPETSSARRPESFLPSTNQLLAVVARRSEESARSLKWEKSLPGGLVAARQRSRRENVETIRTMLSHVPADALFDKGHRYRRRFPLKR